MTVTAAGREGESVGVCDGRRDFVMVGGVGGGRLGVLDKASSPRGGASLGAGSGTLTHPLCVQWHPLATYTPSTSTP